MRGRPEAVDGLRSSTSGRRLTGRIRNRGFDRGRGPGASGLRRSGECSMRSSLNRSPSPPLVTCQPERMASQRDARLPRSDSTWRSLVAEESCCTHGGDRGAPVVSLLGVGGLRADRRSARDVPAGSVGLDGAGGGLPAFGGGQAVGQRAEQIGDVLGRGVGGGPAEPVLIPSEDALHPGPAADLLLVAVDPLVADALGCRQPGQILGCSGLVSKREPGPTGPARMAAAS